MHVQVDELIAGEVGYLAASIKAVADARVGDTITLKKKQADEALAGLVLVLLALFSWFLYIFLVSIFPPVSCRYCGHVDFMNALLRQFF